VKDVHELQIFVRNAIMKVVLKQLALNSTETKAQQFLVGGSL
jgi:hypothetical protein